jgi:hypothetical protein
MESVSMMRSIVTGIAIGAMFCAALYWYGSDCPRRPGDACGYPNNYFHLSLGTMGQAMNDAERLGRLVDIVEHQGRQLNLCRRCGRLVVAVVGIAIVAALVALIYGAVIPMGELFYMYNIEPHSWSGLCGYNPGDPGHPRFGGKCWDLSAPPANSDHASITTDTGNIHSGQQYKCLIDGEDASKITCCYGGTIAELEKCMPD